jgi:membrane protein DedA with SNARE-associated domain
MFSETATYWISHYGYAGLFTLLTLGIVGLPVPDETLLVFSGYLISKGDLSPVPTYLIAFAGSVCGVTLSYLIGRSGGFYLVIRYGRFLRLTPERIDSVRKWFERIGKWILFIGYFFVGVRHLSALVAGSARLEWRTFALFAYPGALVWSVTFVSLGRWLGHHWHDVALQIHRHLLTVTVLTVAALLIYAVIRKKFFAAHHDNKKV